MLRRMSRRVVSHPIALSCVLLAATAPLGCQQVQELINGKTEEKKVETPVTPPVVAPVAPVVVAPTAMPVPVPEKHAVTLDELLGLVHADSTSEFAVVRSPGSLLDLGDEAFKFYDGPVQTLVGLLGAQEVASGFAAAKAGLANARTQLASSGIDLTQGLVVTQTAAGKGSAVFVVVADKPEGVKGLLTALKLPGAEKTVCQTVAAAPGHVACADSEAVLKAYKPGDGKKRHDTAAAALPGVNLDELAVLFYSPDNGGMHMGATTPAGAGVVHIGMAAGNKDMKDVLAGLEPGPSTMLRFVQPGAGFVWARTDMVELKKQPQLAMVPPPFDAVTNGWSGELLFAGSSEPAALQLRLGLGDTKAAEAMIKAGVDAVKKMVPTTVPGLDKSKLKLDMVELKVGTETVQAAHLGLTGVEQAPTLRHLVGLGLDAWMFAAEGSLAIAFGPDAANAGKLVAQSSVDATLASLPQLLAEDLRANQVSFVVHSPLDALQGPSMRKGLDAVLKNVAMYKPDQARSALAMLAPISSGTVWMTEVNGIAVVHLAVQGVGNTTDEEGKAALAAAVAVAGGGDPAVLFGELVTKYPGSPRLAAYQARAGSNGPGVLIGSAIGGMALSGAMAFTILNNMVNPNLATELGVPPPVVEKPVEKKPDPVKTEPVKTDPVKTDPVKTDPVKTDPVKTDPEKTDPVKTDPVKTDPVKTDPVKTDPVKTDPVKTDPVKTDPKKPVRKGRDEISVPKK